MRRKLFFMLLSLTIFINTSSCVTLPPGACDFIDSTDKGTSQVLAIEEFKVDTLNCQNGKVIKFKFLSNVTHQETIYSQAYPEKFITSNKIEVGKSFNVLKQIRYAGPCREELFEFRDIPDYYLNYCGNRNIQS